MVQLNSNYRSIIIDAMGGDFAPGEIIKGSIEAKEAFGAKIKLVGNIGKIKKAAELNHVNLDGIKIVSAPQEVSMDESPSEVLRKKRNSSIYIGSQLASGETGNAFISAGSTGAIMAWSLFIMKKEKKKRKETNWQLKVTGCLKTAQILISLEM